MKIVFINRFFFPDHSATSQLVSDLAFHLADRGFEVHVVTSRQGYEAAKATLPPSETIDGVVIHRVAGTRFGRDRLLGRAIDYLSFYISSGWRLLRIVRRGDVAVAKTDPPLISVVVAMVTRLRRACLVNWLQDVFPEIAIELNVLGFSPRGGRIVQCLRDAALRQAAVNVTLGDKMAEYLIGRGVPRSQVTVVHNWTDDLSVVPVLPEKNRLRQEWGLAGKFVVGYSGNMGRAHEFETVLHAIERFRSDDSIVFLFIGGGNQKAYIEREISKRHLLHVVFKPYQEKQVLSESLCVPDVHLVSLRPRLESFVVPSKFYGVAAAGRPVVFIGDPNGEIGQIVCENNCGAVVHPNDSSELVRVLSNLHRNEGLRRQWGINARQLIESRFSRQHAMSAWQDVLSRVGAIAQRSVPL